MDINELTEKVIGCSFKVYNNLGFGFLESVYEKSLLIELNKIGLKFESQMPIKVRYEDQIVGDFIADIFVEKSIIVELKSVQNLITAHEVQLVNYLKATNTETGLLINFGPNKVEIKRKFKEFNPVNLVNPVKREKK